MNDGQKKLMIRAVDLGCGGVLKVGGVEGLAQVLDLCADAVAVLPREAAGALMRGVAVGLRAGAVEAAEIRGQS